MSYALKQINIAVTDLTAGRDYWQKIIGLAPASIEAPVFSLANIQLALQENATSMGLSGLVFEGPARPDCHQRGIAMHFVEACEDADVGQGGTHQAIDLAVDHVVLRTRDGDAAVAFFAETLGLRLALRQSRPEWGGDMIFFRTQHMSIEVIANSKAPEQDELWGLALRCRDLSECHHRLIDLGIDVSEIRVGRKPGTEVATIRAAPIPLLLIAPQRGVSDP
jgi:catechol 2,3-dioxygenase-like lactoylglutathione lyase family enzyme